MTGEKQNKEKFSEEDTLTNTCREGKNGVWVCDFGKMEAGKEEAGGEVAEGK